MSSRGQRILGGVDTIDPVAELAKASKKKPKSNGRTDPAHLARMTEAAAAANRAAAAERAAAIDEIEKRPPKSAADLAPDALKELAKQLKHKDPRLRKDAMKEVFRLNAQSDDEDPVAEVVYITPAMRDDVEQIEELLQLAVAEKVADDVEHLDDVRAVPAFVPMQAV